jgi:nickel transport protein
MFAHKLNLFLTQENDKVFVSAYFASGTFCKNCKVEVKNENQKLLQSGNTNDKGEFVITKLDSIITVAIDASSGHIVKKSLDIQQIVEYKVSNKEYEKLKEENKRLKSKIAMLEEKSSFSELFKMIFALLVIAGIFFFLKRVKK